VTVHAEVPLQAPLQPAKYAPGAGAAVNFTTVPDANEAVQVPGQRIPDGLLVTVPLLVPTRLTVNVWLVAGTAALDPNDCALAHMPNAATPINNAANFRFRL